MKRLPRSGSKVMLRCSTFRTRTFPALHAVEVSSLVSVSSPSRQAQSRVKMLERMKPVTALVTQDVHDISFPPPDKTLSPPIIAVDDVSVGYDPASPVLKRVTLRIDNDDRIALLGANGNGKSTLVKLLADKLAPFSGRVVRADKLSIGYFAQHQTD